MDVPLWAWLAVLSVIVGMLAVDLYAHRRIHIIRVREAALWSMFWVTLGVAFGGLIWYVYGTELAAQYFSGYVIEKSLSVDNVLLWALIFSYFAVPREYQHKVLFYGILGALVLRGAFIAAGSVLVSNFEWVIYVFGAFLIVSAIKMLRHRDEHVDVGSSVLLRGIRLVVPTTEDFRGPRFWVREGGRWMATPLFAVLLMIEFTDVVFAVDSIPAVFAVTQEPFLVFTSNAFAILGLRAMYFLLGDLIDRFVYLTTGLALVLAMVGVKMMLQIWHIKIPTLASLAVVVVVLAISIGWSLYATTGTDSTATPDPEDGARGASPAGDSDSGDSGP